MVMKHQQARSRHAASETIAPVVLERKQALLPRRRCLPVTEDPTASLLPLGVNL